MPYYARPRKRLSSFFVIVAWAAQARRDLEEIHAYISRETSPERASEVVSDIVVSVNRLADFPGIGRPGRRPGTRELKMAHLPYMIPYRVRGEMVVLLRVLHEARH
jgi:addiction module RelE/StbE family toxin